MAEKYQLTKPRQIHDPSFSPAPGLAIALLPNGKQALTSGLDFQLRLWDLEKGKCMQSWDARGPLFSITLVSKGTTALLGAVQGLVRWDLERWNLGEPNTLWSYSSITAAAYADSTGEVLGGSEDSTIHRWRLPDGEKLSRLKGHKITVTALDLDHAGRTAISGDLYGQLRLWELETGTCLREWQGHEKKVSAVDMSLDGHWALTGSEDGSIILWDLKQRRAARKLSDHGVKDIILSRDKHWAVASSEAGLTLWDLKQGKLLDKFKETRIVALSLSPQEDLLAALIKNNQLLIWPI